MMNKYKYTKLKNLNYGDWFYYRGLSYKKGREELLGFLCYNMMAKRYIQLNRNAKVKIFEDAT